MESPILTALQATALQATALEAITGSDARATVAAGNAGPAIAAAGLVPVLFAISALLSGSAPASAQERSDRPEKNAEMSTHGLPGLVTVPTAATPPVGAFDLNLNTAVDGHLFPEAERQYNLQFSLGFLDRLVIGARGAEVRTGARDLSANLQVLLFGEGRVRPALAVGAHDLGGGAIHFFSRHAVASKTFLSGDGQRRVRLTAGYGTGPDLLDGPFAGLEMTPIPDVSLLVEHDSEQFNAGLRLQPFREALVARGYPRPTVDVVWKETEGFALGLTFRTALGGDRTGGGRGAGTRGGMADGADGGEGAPRVGGALAAGERRPADGPTGDEGLEPLRERLADLGFEHGRLDTTEAGGTLVVHYENRVYTRNALDGLVRVLSAVERLAPETVEALRMVVRRVDVPMLALELERRDLRDFLSGDRSGREFAETVRARDPDPDAGAAAPPVAGAASAPMGARSRWKVDVLVRPRLETLGFWERGVADGRFRVRPEAHAQLARGTAFVLGADLPLAQTRRFGDFDGPLPGPTLDRILIHHARPLGIGSGRARLLVQWSAGRYSARFAGLRQETSLSLLRGRLRLGTDVAILAHRGERFRFTTGEGLVRRPGSWSGLDPDRTMALATGRLHLPGPDLRTRVTAGRFIDRDWGVAAEASRLFRDVEIGFYLRHSERGSLAGIRLELPLAPGRSLRPRRVRPRLPTDYSHGLHSTVFTDVNEIRRDIARILPAPHRLEDAYRDRDRLHPAAVERRIGEERFWTW